MSALPFQEVCRKSSIIAEHFCPALGSISTLRLTDIIVQCDGNRPVCTPCSKRALACAYMTTNVDDTPSMALKRQVEDLKQELKDHDEFLNRLKTIPEKEAIGLLRRLKSTSEPSVTLSPAKGNTHARHQPSEQIAVRGILPPVRTDFEFELMVCHPMAYPALVPVDTASINLSLYPMSAVRQSTHAGDSHLDYGTSAEYQNTTSLYEQARLASTGGVCPRLLIEEPPSALCGADTARPCSVPGPPQARSYLDDRLHRLHIGYWTRVPISDEFAAKILSFYLEVDHPLLGLFDADLFLGDLVDQRLRFCSAFLVSSLLFYVCVSRVIASPSSYCMLMEQHSNHTPLLMLEHRH